MTTTMYVLKDKRAWFYQPDFNRTRHRYRGPRESEKLNLEAGQAYCNVRKINSSLDTINESQQEVVENILEGVSTDTIMYYNDYADPPALSSLSLDGFETFFETLEALRTRVRAIELSGLE